MKSKEVIKKIGVISGLTAGTIFVTLSSAAVIFYNFTLNKRSRIHMSKFSGRQKQKRKISSDEDTVKYSGAGGSPQEQEWFSDAGEEVTITSDDGLKLYARRFRNNCGENKFAITCHGYTSKGAYMADFAKHFYDMGFHVLVPDARSHGASEGTVMGMGWLDRRDILNWIQSILMEAPDAKIILHGVSMGGATVMMVSGEPLPSNVKAIIEDCGYSSVYDEFKHQLKDMFKLPAFPFVNVTSLMSRLRAGYGFKEASCIEQVKKSRTPILFIHGGKDTFVPSGMLDQLYDAAGCEKEKLLVENAYHAISNIVDPELYWKTIRSFLQKHLSD